MLKLRKNDGNIISASFRGKLTRDEDPGVRGDAAVVLGKVFPYITDIRQYWQALHRLMHDEDF